jgi:O-antigen ligase
MNTKATTTTPNFLSQPKGIVWAIILITIAWAALQWALSAMVFLAIVIIFIIGLKKPIWALAALLFQQLTITSYMIPTPFVTLSLRLVLLLLTFLVLSKAIIRKEVDFGPHARRLVIPALLLVLITVLANTLNSLGFDAVFRDFRNVISGLLFAILLPAVIENTKQLKVICTFVFTLATASALISIMQHFNVLGMGHATLIPNFMNLLGRSSGMSEMELELSYVLSVTFMIIVGIYLASGINYTNKKLLVIPGIILIGGLYFSYTRSAIFALGCGLVSIFLFIKLRGKWWIVLVVTFVVLIFLENSSVIAGAGLSGRDSMEQQESSVARAVLWQAGVAIAMDRPLTGIGAGQFIIVSPQYTNRVDPALIDWEANRYWSYRTLGNDPPHNDYLMMWVSYGVLALIMFLWLHFIIFVNFTNSFFKTHNRFLKGLSLGLAAALITYVANSFYHNLLDTMPLFWVLAGFSLVTLKLATKEAKERKSLTSIPNAPV